ncbi:MAG: hypothetical protein ABW110_24125 [Steroidobacteraceae bacterium]
MKIVNRYSLSVLASLVHATLAAAAPSSSSSYVTDPQNSYVEDETSRGIGQVNMITCIMSALRADALVNEGPYNALVDETKCDPSARSEGSQGSSFLNATVNSTRASNDDPMIAKVWIDEEEEGQHTQILVHVAAEEAPSNANPYGIFRVDYCGSPDGASCMMGGFLEGSDNGIRYYEDEGDEGSTKALRLNATGTTAGSGRLQIDSDHEQAEYDFAYNATLFRRRADNNNDQCFSRDASDPDTGFSVWRYGLYDATTGERITRSSGFPIEYTTGGQTYHGYLGYFGLSLPFEAMSAMDSGSTVQKVDYSQGSAPTKTDYTVVKAPGKLTKYTRQERTLQSIDKVKFTTFIGNNAGSFFAGATPNTQYELYWDDANSEFKVSGQMNCSENGCFNSGFPNGETKSVAVSFWQNMGGVQGWSQSLGGELFINLQGASSVVSAATEVVYRKQDLVYPSDLPATLFCVRDCPTAASMTAFFESHSGNSPFFGITANNWNQTQFADVVQYHTDSATALLLDAADEPVTFTNKDALEGQPQYQHGIRSGRLFTTLAAAECASGPTAYCDYKVNELDVYYQWETGPQPFNQFAAVKDSSGEFLAFDAPLNVNFQVPNAPAVYGEFAGQTLVLQYGGFGDLWGIPGKCVSRSTNEEVDCSEQNARYVAAFMIPFDSVVGRVSGESGEYLVKWLEREIRFASKDVSVCTGAGLELSTGLTLPTAADMKDPSDPSSDIYIGDKPSVTDAPRVIHGDVKF